MKKGCTLFLAFLFLNALPVRCDSQDPVRVERLSERVLMLTEDSPMENIIVAVAAKKGIVVIDSTGSPATAALFRKAIEKEFARNDFKYIINTHPHWDHAWGNQVFPEAVVIGHENSLGQAAQQARSAENMLRRGRERVVALRQGLQKAGTDADQKAKLLPEIAFQERIVQGLSAAFSPVPPAISFSDTLTLDMGDVSFKLYFFGRAHSGSDIFIYIPAEKILVTGDIFLDVGWLPLFSGMETLDIPKWCEVLDRLFNDADGFSTVIPGHRKTWSRDKLKMWKEYIENLWTGINAAKKEKLTLAQVLERFPLEERYLYLKELGHSEQRIREFHERNVEAFWRQLLVPITPLIEQATAKDGIAAAIEKCRVLWRSQRDEYDFSERSLNQLGYRFLSQDKPSAAIGLFAFIVELHPASANAYDSLGEAYMVAGDREMAVRNYEKSLELNAGNQNAKDMLKRLRQAGAAAGALTQQETVTAEMIVAKCAEAMGGMEKISLIKTMRVNEIFPDHGEHAMIFEMKRPNWFRNPRINLVFDGKRACFLKGPGNKSGPELVDEDEWKDFEVDMAFHFPAFFDYPAAFAGVESVDGRDAAKLSVNLPLGAVMTYYIDSKSFLIFRAAAKFVLGGKEHTPYRDFFDYRQVNGVLLPHGFSYGSRTGQMKGRVKSIETNFDFPEAWVKIPDILN